MARKRGRPPGFKMPEEHRSKIQVARLLNILGEAGRGELELSNSRFKAIELLLRKAMPDLAAVQHSHGNDPLEVKVISIPIERAENK